MVFSFSWNNLRLPAYYSSNTALRPGELTASPSRNSLGDQLQTDLRGVSAPMHYSMPGREVSMDRTSMPGMKSRRSHTASPSSSRTPHDSHLVRIRNPCKRIGMEPGLSIFLHLSQK